MMRAGCAQEENKKLKSKQREKMQPKMGKLDIDYQVLHDAFFKFQHKPSLTVMGDLYYEGKEFEAKASPQPPVPSIPAPGGVFAAQNSAVLLTASV